MTGWLSGFALCTWALTLGCDGFIVTEYFLGLPLRSALDCLCCGLAGILWLWLPIAFKQARGWEHLPEFEQTPLHEKLNQMLREAWYALPGATGLLGFRLTVTFMPDFSLLPAGVQRLHFISAAMIAAALIVLITPGQLHRVAFEGTDDHRSHKIGS